MPLTRRTAQLLQTKDLRGIKWRDGEANTDLEFSELACQLCSQAWKDIQKDFPEYADITLTARAPDINLLFSQGSNSFVGKIELKSGKGTDTPGSTLGDLDMNMPVIYCLRKKDAFEFRYQQYYNCIVQTERDLFQDRTPRPHVKFEMMTDPGSPLEYVEKAKEPWIEHYARCALNRTKVKFTSWQDDLVHTILRFFIQETSVEEFARLKSA
jgi:hypothetical protein